MSNFVGESPLFAYTFIHCACINLILKQIYLLKTMNQLIYTAQNNSAQQSLDSWMTRNAPQVRSSQGSSAPLPPTEVTDQQVVVSLNPPAPAFPLPYRIPMMARMALERLAWANASDLTRGRCSLLSHESAAVLNNFEIRPPSYDGGPMLRAGLSVTSFTTSAVATSTSVLSLIESSTHLTSACLTFRTVVRVGIPTSRPSRRARGGRFGSIVSRAVPILISIVISSAPPAISAAESKISMPGANTESPAPWSTPSSQSSSPSSEMKESPMLGLPSESLPLLTRNATSTYMGQPTGENLLGSMTNLRELRSIVAPPVLPTSHSIPMVENASSSMMTPSSFNSTNWLPCPMCLQDPCRCLDVPATNAGIFPPDRDE